MGFYGNITNTSKTTFSFDIVYGSRYEMEEANKDDRSDGVFLGRYVLVDYDTDVIEAYYTRPEGLPNAPYMFYNIPNPDSSTSPLTPQVGVVYQTKNEFQTNNGVITNLPYFYQWDENTSQYKQVSDANLTKYSIRFANDVQTYGRGYDSTVWMKTYDGVSNKYKYVMIAELNAAVPTFHLVDHPPTALPVTPYFDRDTTNLDYYLNIQSNYGFRIDAITDSDNTNSQYSDQTINRPTVKYTVDNTGYQSIEQDVEKNVQADIFYNKAGFKNDTHTYIEEDILKDSINYRLTESGRSYGSLPYVNPHTAVDTFNWHLRLPSIGNAICNMWDRIYGNREDNKRYLNFAQKRKDNENNLVTYNQDTVIGIINTAKDMLGYYYIPYNELSSIHNSDAESIDEYNRLDNKAPTYKITHNIKHSKGDIQNQTIEYPILQCLYYDNEKYYHYVYTPTYIKYDEEELQNGTTYYYQTAEGAYRVANPEARKYNNADHEEQTLQFWEKIDGWTLQEIIPNTAFENSIYGLIVEIHKLLGTNIGETRDYGSIQGSINIIKDIVESLELKPDRLVCTNEKGQLTTYDNTYFPSATWDRDEVLNGNGDWVSRFATISVLENSTNDNQNTFKVNNAESGIEAGENIIIIESDNNKDENGNLPEDPKELHSPNNLTLGTRNKWIQLHADNKDDSIEFRHLESPIIGRLRAEQAIGTTDSNLPIYVNKDTTDDNGNVTLKTKDELIAENADFDSFSVNENATEITVKPTTDNLEYRSNESDQNDNRLTIPYLTVDNAGHVVELGTKNFNIPHGFKKIKTTTTEDTVETFSDDQPGISIAESISDTLELAPQNRWIDIATIEDNDAEGSETDKITFGHRLVPTLNTDVTLNGDRRTKDTEIPTVYRYGLPENKTISDLDEPNGANEAANTFNVPYIEVDKAGHIVAAETHTVTLPENFEKVTLTTAKTKIEDSLTSNDDNFNPTTLQDNITFKTHNRWIKANINTEEKSLSFAHETVNLNDTVRVENNQEIKLNNAQDASVLHPERLSDPDIVPTVYRFGLPQDKSIKILDEDNGTELANTFNVPYIEVDKAGHVVAAATHTVTLPHNYESITIGAPSTEVGILSSTGTIGETSDNLASLNQVDLEADTLTENLTISASNKWIRIKGHDDINTDIITIGHELHNIIGSTHTTDLEQVYTDENKQGSFTTQTVQWDNAGHIIGHNTETWKLPYSLQSINVTTAKALNTTENNEPAVEIKSIKTSDSFNFKPANNWIRLQALGHDISFGHLIQGTAGSYTGTDTSFIPDEDTSPRFGQSVTLYGYTTDEAGHVIGYPTYTLTLPIGSYTPKDDTDSNRAKVITSIDFTASSGEITSTSKNVGELKLNGYTKLTTTAIAVITADSTINGAFAALDNRIETEEEARGSLGIFKTISVDNTALEADSNTDTLSITSGDGIVLTPDDQNDSFKISHETGLKVAKGFYKFSTDAYGHVSTTEPVTESDLTDLGVATAASVNKVAWAANYQNFEALYAAVKAKLEEEYTLVPKA